MGLLTWIVVGLVLGIIARLVTRRPIGILKTTLAGLVGAVIGGLIGHFAGYGGIIHNFSVWSLIIAAVVAVVAILFISALWPRKAA